MNGATNYASAFQLRPSLLSLIAGLGIKLPPAQAQQGHQQHVRPLEAQTRLTHQFPQSSQTKSRQSQASLQPHRQCGLVRICQGEGGQTGETCTESKACESDTREDC